MNALNHQLLIQSLFKLKAQASSKIIVLHIHIFSALQSELQKTHICINTVIQNVLGVTHNCLINTKHRLEPRLMKV
jgi:hypothetical protein